MHAEMIKSNRGLCEDTKHSVGLLTPMPYKYLPPINNTKSHNMYSMHCGILILCCVNNICYYTFYHNVYRPTCFSLHLQTTDFLLLLQQRWPTFQNRSQFVFIITTSHKIVQVKMLQSYVLYILQFGLGFILSRVEITFPCNVTVTIHIMSIGQLDYDHIQLIYTNITMRNEPV